MRSVVRCGAILCLALLSLTPVHGQAQLNLSQDLVALGIAPSNMAPNDQSQDAGPLLMAGLNYAKANGISSVVVNPGAYYFRTESQQGVSVSINQLSNVTLDFKGSDLHFASVNAGLYFTGCSNLIVENFTIDRDELSYTQLQVTSVDPALRQIKFTVQPGWKPPTQLNYLIKNPAVAFANPDTLTDVFIFRNGRLWDNYTPMPVQQLFNDDHLDIGPSNFVTSAILSSIRPGDIAVLRVRVGLNAILADCTSCTFRNIQVYSGLSGIDLMGPSSSSVLDHVYVMPKPGTDRLISTVADGITLTQPGPNNTVRLSRSIRTLDDGISPHTWIWGSVQSVSSSNTAVITAGGITALSQSRPLPVASNVVFERVSDGVILGSAVVTAESSITTVSGAKQATVTFDRDLPGNVAGAYVYATDPSWRGDGLRLERNTVQEQGFGRGITLWGLMNTTVSGNYLRRTAMSAVHLSHAFGSGDWLTPPLVGITLSNNVIDGAPTEFDGQANLELAAIQATAFAPNFSVMPTSPNQNLTFTGNFIANAARSAFYIGNTTGANVTNNYLLHPNNNPRQDRALDPSADALLPIAVENSVNVSTTTNPVDTTSGQMWVTDTQYRELAAYAPPSASVPGGTTIRLNAYNLGALAGPTVTLTDADGVNRPMTIQSTSSHALDVQIPAGTALGGAHVTLSSGGTQYFGTLFLDSQDSIPALNGCVYEVSPSALTVLGTATTLPILVVTQPGCGYQVLASDAFVTPGSGGTGTAVINIGFAANSGDAARSTTIEVAGQPLTIRQAGHPVASDLSLDSPTGGVVSTPFLIAGWALNRAAAAGAGVDAIHLYLTSGGSTTFLGVATYGAARADIAAIFGSQFMNSGFTFSVSGLAPGTYTLSVFAHDAMTNTFDASRNVTFTVIRPVPDPHIAVDTPTRNATVTSAFEVGGWLLDAGATTGTGVDDVKIYVQVPGGSAPGVFIGHGRLGLPRADVGAIYGARFNRVGFHFTITGLSPNLGNTLWVIGHDTLTNADTISMSVPFNVDAKALMSIDLPSAEATIASNTFLVSGWAFDRAIEDKSTIGTGVDNIVLYAFHNPGSGEPAIFLGYADYGHIQRADVGQFYGNDRYTPSGYGFIVDRAAMGLGTGEYNIVPIAHSSATGTYNNLAIVRVVLQ